MGVIRTGEEQDVFYDDELLEYLRLGIMADENPWLCLECDARFLCYNEERRL